MFTGLQSAFSGLQAAQVGLSITGHNISNSTVTGYTRQMLVQTDYSSVTVSSSQIGCYKNQLGLGTTNVQIRQLRNSFYDVSYRNENSYANYYGVKATAADEVNTILGELYSEYAAQDTIEGIWVALNEMIQDPGAIETRSTFIASLNNFLNKMKDINSNLQNYQMNLNEQLKGEVSSINSLVAGINELNLAIYDAENMGLNPNDLYDARNLLLDDLSGYVDLTIKEIPVANSSATRIDLLVDGKEILANNIQQNLGLQYINGDYPFYQVVFTNSTEILSCDETVRLLYDDLSSENLGTTSTSTMGSLKATLISRGDVIGDYTMSDDDIGNYLVPTVQKDLDTIVHKIVTLINSMVMDYDSTDLNGDSGIPIFIRVSDTNQLVDADGGIIDTTGLTDEQIEELIASGAAKYDDYSNDYYDKLEDADDYDTLYTLENIMINPAFLASDGYNKLATSLSGDISDNELLNQLNDIWKNPIEDLDGYSIDDYYKKIVTDFAVQAQEDQEKLSATVDVLTLADNTRLTISAVSMDEELSYMIQYQYAYQAAAQVMSTIGILMDEVMAW